MLANLMDNPQLIPAFRFRATMPHRALHDCVGCNPTESRTEHVPQIVDWEVRNFGIGESGFPGSFDASKWIVRGAGTGKDINTCRLLFFLPFP